MNASNENQEPSTLDELHDRLIDNSLRELVGNESPPDLSARLLAANSPAAATVGAASRAAPIESKTRRRAFWAALAVAAMLLVALTLALRPQLRLARMTVSHNPG